MARATAYEITYRGKSERQSPSQSVPLPLQSSSPTVGREIVVVDGAASEWIQIISGGPQGTVLGPLLFILYTSEMFEPVENRLFAYVDDSTLPAILRKTADRPAVAASLDMDLARIQEWCNDWCMILNPNKTKALVVSIHPEL